MDDYPPVEVLKKIDESFGSFMQQVISHPTTGFVSSELRKITFGNWSATDIWTKWKLRERLCLEFALIEKLLTWQLFDRTSVTDIDFSGLTCRFFGSASWLTNQNALNAIFTLPNVVNYKTPNILTAMEHDDFLAVICRHANWFERLSSISVSVIPASWQSWSSLEPIMNRATFVVDASDGRFDYYEFHKRYCVVPVLSLPNDAIPQLAVAMQEMHIFVAPYFSSSSQSIGLRSHFDKQVNTLNAIHTLIRTKGGMNNGSRVKIGLIDTGLEIGNMILPMEQVTFRYLRFNIEKNALPHIDCAGYGTANDCSGHGTHCAGIIFATSPDVELVVYRVFDNEGNCCIDDLCAPIDDAVLNGIKIMNLSLGTNVDSAQLFHSIQNAVTNGVMVVCAAANTGISEIVNISFPARYGNVLCVGSHDFYGSTSDFSSIGREVDFLAPGRAVASYGLNPFEIVHKDGTSMAAPYVSGLLALLIAYSRNQGWDALANVSNARNLLRNFSRTPADHSQHSGHGALMPLRALQYLTMLEPNRQREQFLRWCST